MEIPKRSSSNIIYITKLSNADHVASMVLLLHPCIRKDESTDDHLQNRTTVKKSSYQIEGLDDGFYKQYETYAQIVIDTTSTADITPHISKEILEKLALFTSFEDVSQQKIVVENPASSVSGIYAIMKIDSIFCFMDSVFFDVKSVNKNTIVFSLNMTGSDIEEKQYRLRGENIMATPKNMIIIEKI